MKISKNKIMYLIVMGLLFGLFNLIAFLIPFGRNIYFWVAYTSITLSFLIVSVVTYLIFDKKDMKSRFYGIPLVYVLRSYIILQFIVGMIQMNFALLHYKYYILINSIILVLNIIGLIGLTVGKDEVERIDKKAKEKVLYLKEMEVKLEGMIEDSQNSEVLESLKKLKDLIRYSDPMSNEKVEALEANILQNINSLNDLEDKEKSIKIDEITKQVNERNRLVKVYK